MLEPTPRLANIRLHPIKSLDPVEVSEARISPSGGLVYDRAWALYSVDGKWVNGKRTALIHFIRASYSPDVRSVTLSVPGDRRKIPARTFAFPEAHEEAAEWFSVFFEQQIIVRHSENGFPDDSIANGPTIVSTASLQAVSAWFTRERQFAAAQSAEQAASAQRQSPERRLGSNDSWPAPLSADDLRLRFRTTLEIDFTDAEAHDAAFIFAEELVLPEGGNTADFEGGAEAEAEVVGGKWRGPRVV